MRGTPVLRGLCSRPEPEARLQRDDGGARRAGRLHDEVDLLPHDVQGEGVALCHHVVLEHLWKVLLQPFDVELLGGGQDDLLRLLGLGCRDVDTVSSIPMPRLFLVYPSIRISPSPVVLRVACPEHGVALLPLPNDLDDVPGETALAPPSPWGRSPRCRARRASSWSRPP